MTFFVPGIPRPQGSKRGFIVRDRLGKQRIAMAESSAKDLKPWRAIIGLAARQSVDGDQVAMHGEACRLMVSFVFPKPKSVPKARLHHTTRPDLSKLVRAVEDALEGILYLHDSQIVEAELRKAYGSPPGVHVTFEVLR